MNRFWLGLACGLLSMRMIKRGLRIYDAHNRSDFEPWTSW